MRIGINIVNAQAHGFTNETMPMSKRPSVEKDQKPLGYGRALQRYKLLAMQLADDYAKERGESAGTLAWGWQTAVARALGVKQDYLSKVLFNGLEPAVDVFELAMDRTRISSTFFFGHFAKEPHYHNFRGPLRMQPSMGYPGLQRFYDLNCFGLKPTDQERHLLERQEWEGEPTERTYDLFLQALRTVQGVATTEVREKVTPIKKAKGRD